MSFALKLFKKSRTVWRLPVREKCWILFLYPYSGLIRLMILTVPFKWLSYLLGQHYQNHQLSPLVSDSQRLVAWRIGRITELTACYTPWESKCLVQAIMARTLLGFYHIPYIIHLGAKMSNEINLPMKAHAWVKVGGWVIAGREGHRRFGIVSSFVAPSVID